MLPAFCLIAWPAWGQNGPSLDRAAVTKAFINAKEPTNQKANIAFIAANPELSYEIFRDTWKSITDSDCKAMLLTQFDTARNPHIFAILDIGANDSDGWTKDRAYSLIRNYSYRYFRWEEKLYKPWYDLNKDKTPEAAIVDNGKAIIALIPKLEPWQRPYYIEQFQHVDFTSDTPLAKLRRKTLVDAGIWDTLKQALASPIPAKAQEQAGLHESALKAVIGLGATEDFARTYILPLTDRVHPEQVREAAVLALGTVQARWPSEKLLQMLPMEYPGPLWENIATALGKTNDPRNIPPLIAILDSDDGEETMSIVNTALGALTHLPVDTNADAEWWHRWWTQNRAKYPTDVAAMSIPDLHLTNTPRQTGFLRRRKVLRQVENDPQRTYMLLTPGLAGVHAVAAVASGPKKEGISEMGLLVVLVGGGGNGIYTSDYWQQVAQKALHDNYMIALAIAPRWSGAQSTAWITNANRATVPEARFTTESYVADIVRDVEAKYPINPAHVFLHGSEEGGIAAYACSLDATTPFKGFYILSTAFRSAQLPPLTNAKNRRYLIQHSQTDKIAPYWTVTAGAEMLKKQGAIVKLAPYQGDHGYKFTGDPWQPIHDAVVWLETGK